jgi:hypothetical protein
VVDLYDPLEQIAVGAYSPEKRDVFVTVLAASPEDASVAFFRLDEGEFRRGPSTFRFRGPPHLLAAGDFTGTGRAGFFKASYLDTTARVLVGETQEKDSDGYWESVESPLDLGFRPAVVELADVDGDGKADLLAVEAAAGAAPVVHVLLSRGDGTFRPGWSARLDGIEGARAIAVADLDGDGKADLVVLDAKGVAAVIYGDGRGAFGNK